jgi:hypothetical protein
VQVNRFEEMVDGYFDYHRPYEFSLLSEMFAYKISHSVRYIINNLVYHHVYGAIIDGFWIYDQVYWTLWYSACLHLTVHCYTHTHTHTHTHTPVSTVTALLC